MELQTECVKRRPMLHKSTEKLMPMSVTHQTAEISTSVFHRCVGDTGVCDTPWAGARPASQGREGPGLGLFTANEDPGLGPRAAGRTEAKLRGWSRGLQPNEPPLGSALLLGGLGSKTPRISHVLGKGRRIQVHMYTCI